MKIKTQILRAADEFRGKADVRRYINGIHINKNFVEATNGHIAVRMDSGIKTRLDIIVRFKGKIPKSAKNTKLSFSKGENVAYHYDNLGQLVSVQVFDLEEAKFPNMDKIIPTELTKGEFPAIQPSFLGVIDKAFGSKGMHKFVYVKPVQYAINKAVVFSIGPKVVNSEFGNPTIVIMPTREKTS